MGYNTWVTNDVGGIAFQQEAQSTGVPLCFYLESALNTGGTASTEWKNVYWNFSTVKQWATGDLAFNRDFYIGATGYVFDTASTVTVGASLAVGGGPAARTNATITNSVSVLLDNWQPNATSGFNLVAGIPGIEDGQGNVVTRCAIYVSDLFGNSFGDQTANVTNIYGIAVPIVNLTASANTRTVTGNVASIYVAGAINLGSHLSFSGTSYSVFVDAGLSRFDGGVIFGTTGQTTLANYEENTFTPTVTLVGGAGNTVPVYSTNTGRYTRIGRQVFVDVYLTGDGGAEGAGTGTYTVALPFASSASHPPSFFTAGYAINNVTEYEIYGQITASGSTIALEYFSLLSSSTAFTGADQNSTTRTVRLKFSYEV